MWCPQAGLTPAQGQVWGQHPGETCSHPVISKEFTEGAVLSKRGAPLGHI